MIALQPNNNYDYIHYQYIIFFEVMSVKDILLVALGSGGLAAFLTTLFTRKSHEENVTFKYVTDERRKWRENLKEIMGDLCDAVHASRLNDTHIHQTRRLATLLKLNLNNSPSEHVDRNVLELLNKLCKDPQYIYFKSLEKQVGTLLKHDWERVKLETNTRSISIVTITLATFTFWGGFKLLFLNSEIMNKLQSFKLLTGLYQEILIFGWLIVVITFLTPRLIKHWKLKSCKSKYYK